MESTERARECVRHVCGVPARGGLGGPSAVPGAALLLLGTLLVAGCTTFPGLTYTETEATQLEAEIEVVLRAFTEEITGSAEFLKTAKGVLIFPAVYQAGFMGGAQYGEGALRIADKTVAMYNLSGVSFGAQLGAQKTSLLIMFMKESALQKFRASHGFEFGLDATATVLTIGATASFDTTKAGEPILAFAFGQRGLMAGVTLAGTKLTHRDLMGSR